MMTRRLITRSTALLLAGLSMNLPAAANNAGPWHSHDAIRDAVRSFLQTQAVFQTGEISIEVRRLDTRLRLARCDRPLVAQLPPSGKKTGRVTVGVRCEGESPWSLYVPARVSVMADVVVARRALKRGQRIRAEDLALEEQDLSRLHRAWFTRLDEVTGKVADRSVRPGRVINPKLLSDPLAVERGSRVNIVARIGGIQASMPGRALDDGALGERIRIKNLASKRELEARVVATGTVRVDI